jgi:Uma2 family endonuclease
MATKTPQPTPNQPNRPAASRTRAKAVPKPVLKAKPAPTAKKAASAAKPAKATSVRSDASKIAKGTAAKPVKPVAAKPTPSKGKAQTASREAPAKSIRAVATNGRKMEPAAQTTPAEASAHENYVVRSLFDSLEAHVAAHRLGHVVGPKQFDLGVVDPTGRLPDIAFVSFDRWAEYRRVPSHDHWHVAPDLLVQIVRRGELAEDFTVHLAGCFNAGVRRVWLLFPDKSEVRVYESPTDVHTLVNDQSIEGEDVLPGFEHSLASLFREPKDLN